MIIENYRANKKFYSYSVYSYLIREYVNIGISRIDKNEMHDIVTPSNLKSYQKY